jgi:uncharacterized membrane-anchored protein
MEEEGMLKKGLILIFIICTPLIVFSEQQSTISEDEGNLIESQYEMTEDEKLKDQKFFSLDWKESGRHNLLQSNSTISLPNDYLLLIGEEAKKGITIYDVSNTEDVEAVVYDNTLQNTIIFEYLKSGYVPIDDWSEVDPNSLLKEISEATEETNEERRKRGIEEVHVTGWLKEPTLDKHTNTVYWAIEGECDNKSKFVNSIALRLCRYGFERVTWITQKESYASFGDHLDVMLHAHSFNPGYCYVDFVKGDEVAGYGIAALVAATVGGKVAKATGLAIILKKAGTLIFAAIAALFLKIKGIFNRKKSNKSDA